MCVFHILMDYVFDTYMYFNIYTKIYIYRCFNIYILKRKKQNLMVSETVYLLSIHLVAA